MASEGSEFGRSWQQFQNAFRLAMDSIRAHKLRSFLTLLGVIIGVASVILVGAAIDGLDVYAKDSTSKAFGAESFIVAQIASAGRISRTEYFRRIRRNKPIRDGDLQFVETVAGNDVLLSPYRNHTSDVKRDNLSCDDTQISGVSADMVAIRDIDLSDGRFFTEAEDRARLNVAVIGDTVKEALFPFGVSPLGKTIHIEGIDFNVVGVLAKLGSSFGRDQDKMAYIPAGAYERLYGPGTGYAVFGRPKRGLTLNQALDETRVALRTRFHTRPGEEDNFDTITPDAVRGFIDQMLGMVAVVVVPVTCISLVVGGIVIMNIMLVSVTERTREIGLRKSLGARRGDILLQILIEAVALASVGGGLGVVAGALLTLLVGQLFGLRLEITPGYVLLSITVSGLVGIASGWYPAARASRLDPVVALRAE